MLSLRIVPNEFPSPDVIAPYRIAIIGEAPGAREDELGKPFSGPSGAFLNALLADASIRRDACFVGNVCQVRPPGNDIYEFVVDKKAHKLRMDIETWGSAEIKDGLQQLRSDIVAFNPNLCILLGDTALRSAGVKVSISDFRGYVFTCDQIGSPMYGRRCIATYHPAALFRMYEYTAVVRFDLKKARMYATQDVAQRSRDLDVQGDFQHIIDRLRRIRQLSQSFAFDIEGYVNGMKCCSLAVSPTEAFIVPFVDMAMQPLWTVDEEATLLYELALTLEAPNCQKLLQNGMYDRFVLAYTNRVLVNAQSQDTMLKHWELYSEMEKGLGFMTSLYTQEPYYKGEMESISREAFWKYCCKDSALTYEISDVLETKLARQPMSKEHYNFNLKLLNPMLYIELKGMRLDEITKERRLNGNPTTGDRGLCDIVEGEQKALNVMAGKELNVRSSPQMIEFLYEDLGLPKQYNKVSGNETSEYKALLMLHRKVQMPILKQCILVRQMRKRITDINSLWADPDGRVRASINVVGTETGRLTNRKSPTGRGTNLQTVTKDDRDLLISDAGYDFAQADLSGADGWTVAAHCAALGDSTMMDDLLYDLKIPKLIGLIVKYGTLINQKSRAELKILSNEIDKNADEYQAFKQTQHGSNYLMGAPTVALRVFLESEGRIFIEDSVARTYQNAYFSRYGKVRAWHEKIEWQVKKFGYLQCASGQRRIFFGRKDDRSTLGEALSQEPQANTTYATNKALLNLWNDPANRNPKGGLIIQPLHQVHDALCCQWPSDRREWAVARLREYFDFPLSIAGQQIRIPFDGSYGRNWRLDPAKDNAFPI